MLKRALWVDSTLKVVLAIAFLTSVLLTFGIFNLASNAGTGTTGVEDLQLQNSLFQPRQFLYTDKSGDSYQYNLSTKQEGKIIDLLSTAEFGSFREDEYNNRSLADLLSQPETVVLHYSDVTPVAYFNGHSEDTNRHIKNKNFDYVIFSIHGGHNVYFVDSRQGTVNQTTFKQVNWHRIQAAVNDWGDSQPVIFAPIKNQINVLYSQSFSRPVYTYQIHTSSVDDFNAAMLGSVNQFSTSKVGDLQNYHNNYSGQSNTYHPNNQTLVFQSENEVADPAKTYLGRLKVSFDQLEVLKKELPNLGLFQSSDHGGTISFRTYVDNVPIFFDGGLPTLTSQIDDKGRRQATYKLEGLGIPAPNSEGQVKLDSTNTVLKKLNNSQKSENSYQQLMVGYVWQVNKDNKNLVDLVPTWMVQDKNGTWYSLDDYLERTQTD
ncbi:hypothetical protein [Eupransor demetentiae]|uniref:Regulator of the WalKR two-component signal transduction system (YycH) n=1 Tax=Eupransor demetentiae TaxID=3109584 RepID=A0ABP0ER97_9LACO|nr:YycH protein [Lactobacillaceae bacterium LMG 33000]